MACSSEPKPVKNNYGTPVYTMAHLLSDMDAVAQGLSVTSSRILVDSLPSLIEGLLGPLEGSVIVAGLLEKGAREGFTRFMERRRKPRQYEASASTLCSWGERGSILGTNSRSLTQWNTWMVNAY